MRRLLCWLNLHRPGLVAVRDVLRVPGLLMVWACERCGVELW